MICSGYLEKFNQASVAVATMLNKEFNIKVEINYYNWCTDIHLYTNDYHAIDCIELNVSNYDGDFKFRNINYDKFDTVKSYTKDVSVEEVVNDVKEYVRAKVMSVIKGYGTTIESFKGVLKDENRNQ